MAVDYVKGLLPTDWYIHICLSALYRNSIFGFQKLSVFLSLNLALFQGFLRCIIGALSPLK